MFRGGTALHKLFFLDDIWLLIPAGINYDPVSAATLVQDQLIARLPGKPWKGSGAIGPG